MIRDRFTDEERKAFYNAIIHLDPDKNLVIADKENDTLSYNDKKITCHEKISGRPGDEELTRALIILHLINNFDYEPEKIEIESSFSIGGHKDKNAP